MEIRLGEADKPEILRYLEYRNQEITESLNRQIEYGMDMVNQAASFRYVQKELTELFRARDAYRPLGQ